MLTPVLAHPGQPPAPTTWEASGTCIRSCWAACCWPPGPTGAARPPGRRGQTAGPPRPVDTWRARCFAFALVTLGVALVSPLDALSGALASAHMVQHLLLVVVAAPLLALSAPASAILRGSPLAVRQAAGRWPCGRPPAAGGGGSG